MHLVKKINVIALAGQATDIQAQCVQLQFFQILCCLLSSRKFCDVQWFFFYRGTQPHHLSLLSELCVVHIKAYACISCCDAALLLSRCVFSASLYSRYLWMWVWPLMGSFLNSVSWSSALLCSDVVLSSLMRLNWVLSYVSFQLWIKYQLSQRFLLSFLQRNWDRIESLVVIQ